MCGCVCVCLGHMGDMTTVQKCLNRSRGRLGTDSRNHVLDVVQDRTNLFAAMRPFAKVFKTLVIIIIIIIISFPGA